MGVVPSSGQGGVPRKDLLLKVPQAGVVVVEVVPTSGRGGGCRIRGYGKLRINEKLKDELYGHSAV